MARRGENIHKRKDGRWEGRYIKARTPDRRICWGYIYGTTYAEVKQRLIHKKSEYGGFQLIDKDDKYRIFVPTVVVVCGRRYIEFLAYSAMGLQNLCFQCSSDGRRFLVPCCAYENKYG